MFRVPGFMLIERVRARGCKVTPTEIAPAITELGSPEGPAVNTPARINLTSDLGTVLRAEG